MNADPATLLIHGDAAENETTAVSPPIFQTSTFAARSAEEFRAIAAQPRHDRFYTRHGNPNHAQAAKIIAALEGGEDALLFASGMGAIAATALTILAAGDHCVVQQEIYGGTRALLERTLVRFGVGVTFVNQTDLAAFERAIQPRTRLFVLESPSNPKLGITDLAAVSSLARAHTVTVLADNTFATPINQRPLDFGIDAVAHSGTKYLGGHADIIAGALVGSKSLIDAVYHTAHSLGATLGPFDCWLMLRGMRTLELRVSRQNENAQAIAEHLQSHEAISKVNYPGLPSHPGHDIARAQMRGFGGILSFEVRGDFARAERFLDRLELPQQAASVGGVESLVVHPAAMWASTLSNEQIEAAGISPGLVRLSVGIESLRDLIADLDRALAGSA